jgi:hypothetical protein
LLRSKSVSLIGTDWALSEKALGTLERQLPFFAPLHTHNSTSLRGQMQKKRERNILLRTKEISKDSLICQVSSMFINKKESDFSPWSQEVLSNQSNEINWIKSILSFILFYVINFISLVSFYQFFIINFISKNHLINFSTHIKQRQGVPHLHENH